MLVGRVSTRPRQGSVQRRSNMECAHAAAATDAATAVAADAELVETAASGPPSSASRAAGLEGASAKSPSATAASCCSAESLKAVAIARAGRTAWTSRMLWVRDGERGGSGHHSGHVQELGLVPMMI